MRSPRYPLLFHKPATAHMHTCIHTYKHKHTRVEAFHYDVREIIWYVLKLLLHVKSETNVKEMHGL